MKNCGHYYIFAKSQIVKSTEMFTKRPITQPQIFPTPCSFAITYVFTTKHKESIFYAPAKNEIGQVFSNKQHKKLFYIFLSYQILPYLLFIF